MREGVLGGSRSGSEELSARYRQASSNATQIMPLDEKNLEIWNELLIKAYQSQSKRLEQVVRYSLGGMELYTDFTYEKQRFRDVVADLTKRLEKDGITVQLARRVVNDCPEMRDAIGAILPEALQQAPEAVSEIAAVSKAIDLVRMRLKDHAVSAEVALSRNNLERLRADLNLLRCYKALHECLHSIQLQQLQLIIKAARTFVTDENSYGELSLYETQLQMQAMKARKALKDLPDWPDEKASEIGWVDALDATVKGFQRALDTRDAQEAAKSVYQLKSILRKHPARLDEMMVVTARRAPLRNLIATLEAVRTEDDDSATELGDAVESLQRLLGDLLGRVAEHAKWQDVTTSLWAMDESLSRDDPEEVQFLWPDLKKGVEELRATDPGRQWVDTLAGYGTSFEQAFPQMPLPPVPPAARSQFARFLNAAIVQFFKVDEGLDALCGDIVKLGPPLQALLEEAPGE